VLARISGKIRMRKMKIVTASGKQKVVMTRKEWEAIGKKAGWKRSVCAQTAPYKFPDAVTSLMAQWVDGKIDSMTLRSSVKSVAAQDEAGKEMIRFFEIAYSAMLPAISKLRGKKYVKYDGSDKSRAGQQAKITGFNIDGSVNIEFPDGYKRSSEPRSLSPVEWTPPAVSDKDWCSILDSPRSDDMEKAVILAKLLYDKFTRATNRITFDGSEYELTKRYFDSIECEGFRKNNSSTTWINFTRHGDRSKVRFDTVGSSQAVVVHKQYFTCAYSDEKDKSTVVKEACQFVSLIPAFGKALMAAVPEWEYVNFKTQRDIESFVAHTDNLVVHYMNKNLEEIIARTARQVFGNRFAKRWLRPDKGFDVQGKNGESHTMLFLIAVADDAVRNRTKFKNDNDLKKFIMDNYRRYADMDISQLYVNSPTIRKHFS
jgi:hypothetical protein